MRITFLSDTHNKHEYTKLDGGDILCFTGDFMTSGYNQMEVNSFLEWIKKQKYFYKLCVSGNHDRFCETFPKYQIKDIFEKYYNDGVRYLQDDEIEIEGLKFYATPYQNYFCGWAWNVQDTKQLGLIYDQIPDGLDVLMTHVPPKGILDKSHVKSYRNPTGEEPLGSKELLERLQQMKNPPRYHCFGHIHGDGGKTVTIGETTYINASVCDEGYKPSNQIITLEIEPRG